MLPQPAVEALGRLPAHPHRLHRPGAQAQPGALGAVRLRPAVEPQLALDADRGPLVEPLRQLGGPRNTVLLEPARFSRFRPITLPVSRARLTSQARARLSELPQSRRRCDQARCVTASILTVSTVAISRSNSPAARGSAMST